MQEIDDVASTKDFPQIPNTVRITFRYSTSRTSASHALHNLLPAAAVLVANCHKQTLELENDYGVNT